jgi:acetyl esterase
LNVDTTRTAVGGDSAGGNLAAVVAQMVRDQGGPALAFQLLIYPATDFTAKTLSLEENGQGYFLTSEDMTWFTNHYLNNVNDKTNPLASPALAANLSGLPPALVITAEYDPLRDEGELYGQRLTEAGVSVTVSRYDGMIHGFMSISPIFDRGKRGIDESAAALRAAFTVK